MAGFGMFDVCGGARGKGLLVDRAGVCEGEVGTWLGLVRGIRSIINMPFPRCESERYRHADILQLRTLPYIHYLMPRARRHVALLPYHTLWS